MAMKIVLVGAGKVGYAAAKLLSSEGHDVTVIEQSEEKIARISDALDVGCLEGSGTDFELLEEAGIASADVLIAAAGSDEANLVCCAAAQRIAAEKHNTSLKTVARVRDPQYLRQTRRLADAFGISLVFNPELEAASEMARILQFPSVVGVDTFSGSRLELVEYVVGPEAKLDGVVLKDLGRKFSARVLVCTAERAGAVIIPNGSFVIRTGDRLSIAAERKEIRRFFKETGSYRKPVQNAILFGGGRIGVYLAAQLTEAGIRTTVIERDMDRCAELGNLLPKADIVCGDGTKRDLLDEEHLSQKDAFAALSDDDEDNIIVSLYAGSVGVGKVITKLNDTHLSEMLSGMGLDCVVTPKELVAQILARYVRALSNAGADGVEALYRIAGNRAEALEFRVGERSGLAGRQLRDLKLRRGILIAALLRGDKCIIPNGSDFVYAGDRAVIVTTAQGLEKLDSILEA